MSNIGKITVLGIIVGGSHYGINLFLLQGKWQLSQYYWLDLVLIGLSLLIVFATEKIGQKDPNKIGVAYSILGMVRLLIVATIILVLSKSIDPDLKSPLIVHFCIPAFIFILFEALLVKKFLKEAQ